MPQRIIGLDIGSYSIKVAEIVRGLRSFELVHFYEKPVQYNDVLTKEESLTAAIQSVLEDNALQWDDVVCALPGERGASRLITLPFGNARKIDQTVEFEIEEYLPFELDDVVFDYCATIIDKNLSKVLVTYASKGDFVKYLTMLNNSGVDPKIISEEGAELINLMQFGLVPPEGSYAIVDIGHSKTTVTIGRGKKLVLTRTIPIAGERINEAIHKHLELPIDEAARLKVDAGHISIEDSQDVDKLTSGMNLALKEVVDELLIHIRQTFFSYRNNEDEAVAGVYLSGGTSRLPGLDQYISYKLRQNVTFIDCADFHFSRLDRAEVHSNVVAQALALALRGVSMGGGSGINFRSGEFAYRGSVKKLGGGIRQFAVAAGLIVFLGSLYFGVQFCALKKKTERVSGDIVALISQALPDISKNTIRSPSSGIALLKSKKVEISDRMLKLEEALGTGSLDVLREISKRIPAKDELTVDIEDFSMNKGRIRIVGRTTSFEAVDKITSSMEGSEMFEKVTKGNVRKGVKGEIKFDLTMELTAPEGS
jgi:general secretion pathway protein L